MSLYDGIKDVAKVIQKADNVDLYRQLLDLCQQALDMQAEIERLTKETRELRDAQELKTKIIRHDEPFITLEGHPDNEMYCSTCYAKERLLIQVQDFHNGYFRCPNCNTNGVCDQSLANRRFGNNEGSPFTW